MGRQRKESLLEVLVDFPWWVSVVAAGVVYVLVKWVAPAAFASNAILAGISKGLSGTPVAKA